MKKKRVPAGNAAKGKSILVRNDAKAKVSPVAETQTFTFNFLPKSVRKEKLEDKEYTVVPMVILTEGVHNGSNGALYYPPEELAKTPEAWDHKPIVVYHPEGSACKPEVINERKVGLMMNTKWDRKNKRLKSEAWIDMDRASKIDERVPEAINTNTVMEVSTGLNMDAEDTEGEWNGEEYDYIARNYRPDHLAILPDQIGACSTRDGAGLLRNAAASGSLPPKLDKKVRALLRELGVTSNALSFDQIRGELSTAIREKLNIPENNVNGPYCWIDNVYSNFFTYEYDGDLFRLGYSTSAMGVTLDDEAPTKVVKDVKYREVADATANRDQLQKEQTMKLNKEQRKKHIDGLIANKESGWSEEDRPVLDAMKDTQLVALAEALAPEEEEEQADPPPTKNTTRRQTTVTTNEDQTANKKALVDEIIKNNTFGWEESDRMALMSFTPEKLAKFKPAQQTQNNSKPLTAEEWMAAAPAGAREMITNGLEMFNEEKTRLIGVIANHESKAFTEDQLKNKPLGELRALAKLCEQKQEAIAGYFGGLAPTANVTSNSSEEEEPLGLPTMNFDKEQDEPATARRKK